VEIPENLIVLLERSAEEARAALAGLEGEAREVQRGVWRDAAVAVQAAITGHTREAGVDRYELETAVKQAVRHPADAPA